MFRSSEICCMWPTQYLFSLSSLPRELLLNMATCPTKITYFPILFCNYESTFIAESIICLDMKGKSSLEIHYFSTFSFFEFRHGA